MKKYLLAILVAASLINPAFAMHCEDPNSNTNPKQHSATIGHPDAATSLPCPPTSLRGVADILQTVFNVLLGLMILAASFMLLYAAFLYVTSEGSQEETRKVKRMIVYVVISLIVAAFAWGLPKVIASFLS